MGSVHATGGYCCIISSYSSNLPVGSTNRMGHAHRLIANFRSVRWLLRLSSCAGGGLTRCRSRRSGVRLARRFRASLGATLRVAPLECGAATRLSINPLARLRVSAHGILHAFAIIDVPRGFTFLLAAPRGEERQQTALAHPHAAFSCLRHLTCRPSCLEWSAKVDAMVLPVVP